LSEHKTELCKLCNSDVKNVGPATGNKNITLNIELKPGLLCHPVRQWIRSILQLGWV